MAHALVLAAMVVDKILQNWQMVSGFSTQTSPLPTCVGRYKSAEKYFHSAFAIHSCHTI